MADEQPKSGFRKAMDALKDALAIKTAAGLAISASSAAGVAVIALWVQAGVLVAIFGSLSTFGAVVWATNAVDLWRQKSAFHRSRTWLQVSGGSALVITVQHSGGPPVNVRVRGKFHQLLTQNQKDLVIPLAPFDIDLSIKNHGGSRQLVQISQQDIAKATVAHLGSFDNRSYLHLHGWQQPVLFIGKMRLSFDLTLLVSSPAGERDTHYAFESLFDANAMSIRQR